MEMTLSASSSKRLILFVLLSIAFISKAQQGANIYSGDSLGTIQKKIILVPFDPMLYNSEIDRELAKFNNLNFDQIREKFRTELDLQIGMFLKGKHEVIAPLRERDEAVRNDLKVIYSGIAFNYAPLPSANGKGPKSSRSEIRNGQIVEIDNSGHKYMSTVIKDLKVLEYLNGKYSTDLYVFITQFEIKNDMSDQMAVAMGTYTRNVLVHYNVVDNQGKIIYGGIAKTMIPTREYDIKKLAASSLRDIAMQVSASIPEVKKQTTPIKHD